MINNPSWNSKVPESALCTDVSVLETTEHEKNKEKENKCKVIKAGCAGTYIKQCAEEPRRSGGAVRAAGAEAYGFQALQERGPWFFTIDGYCGGSVCISVHGQKCA